jgi:hypothetical protein
VTYQPDRREVLRARVVLIQAVEDIQRELAELEGKSFAQGKMRRACG